MSGRKAKTSEVCQKLKEIHPWADDTLIVDVMAGVNDFSTALTLLEAMVSPDNGFDIDKPLSGWAAFDLNERLKQQDIEPEPERETFPHLSVPATSLSDPSQSIGAMLEKPFSSVLVPSVSFPSLLAKKGSDANLIQVGNSRLSQSDGFIKERDFHELCQKLKEIHPWADDTLIVDVMAGVNDFSTALTLLEAMVSPDNGFDIDKSLTGWAGFDLNERLKQQDIEPEPERETFPHLSIPATSLSDPSQSIGAMLEKPFLSMLVPSVSSPSLMANKGSDANLIQVGNSRLSQSDGFIKERDIHEVCQKLKEIHPWADDTLIVDVMADVNDFSTALTLLEAMVSPDNGFDIDKSLTGWAAFDLNERLKQQDIEPEPERETFPHLSVPATSLSDPSQSIGAMLEKPFPSMLVPSVSSPSLMANKGSDANLIQVGNSRLSQSDGFIKERDFHEVCQKLKEIHPWADDTLIVDVMADVNDFSTALTLLEAMVSPDNGFDIDKSLTGWAAFDLNERLKQQDIEPEPERETFPHLSVPATSLSDPSQSIGAMLEKPFPSMLVPSVSSPSLMANKGSDANLIQVGNSRLSQSDGFIKERDIHEVCQKLKEIHPWADDTLIVDVMADVNDFSTALTLLEAMVSPDNGFDIDKSLTPKEADTPSMQKLREVDTDTEGVKSSNKDSFTTTSKFAATDSMNLDELSNALAKCLQSNSRELISNCVSHENKLHFDGAVGSMMFVPVEPEWEEDDIYSIHRKDAMKMTRSAAQHSKAASEAYRRGDHVSAQHFSLKAKEERVVANRLNSEAAKKILIARNCKNDQWTLDLHGLHATEAVQAVQEHLQKIESQMTQNGATHVNQVNLFESAGRIDVNLFESAGRIDVENENKVSLLNKQRPAFLEVITGRGIHSRGQPALPTFIRSFLIENGYRYEERRPGVITVRPKFRPR
ncbi:uncharacterized protein LOC132067990 [Lycium ferocissimum]|uniref:uncharacterized protein LOC132067990 n=1 Tax=Lycium ferocissimum TaxID=112874 RepID=UPI0028157323|nr:uncharacterized protein LOC132067990 [Lycium ferocissimum]